MNKTTVGASSLLVIFAVLSLTVFALLSVSTVQADQGLADRAAAAVLGYYEADCQAEEILAQLRAGDLPAGVTEENGVYSYECEISDTQCLAVQVKVEDSDYTILRWQTVQATEWQADDSLSVWMP
jgi:hypothetical protein